MKDTSQRAIIDLQRALSQIIPWFSAKELPRVILAHRLLHCSQGKELWFYQCTDPVRMHDPQEYYRHQAWKSQAQKVLDEAVQAVTATWNPSSYTWKAENNINLADTQLAKVRQLLITAQ